MTVCHNTTAKVAFPVALTYAVYAVIVSPYFSEVLPMKPETAEKVKYVAMGLFVGVILPMTIGFEGGFWVTKRTSEQMANAAVLTAPAAVRAAPLSPPPSYHDGLAEKEAVG